MVELFILIVIVILVVLAIRGGTAAVPDEPLIIQQPGRYHITLAPQLNRAQTFIKNIAKQFAESGCQAGDAPTQYFEVRDPSVFARGESCYLLAVALRGGMLYFQAINPQPLLRDADSHLKIMHEFSEAVLERHPLGAVLVPDGDGALTRAVETAAHPMKINVCALSDSV